MKHETPAEYDARIARCREIAATMDRPTAHELVVNTGNPFELEPDARDRYVAANMRLRGEV